uniref:Reverse transcriptase zinc-binding domain-containing protein n=1 Tax=Cannabis sativa TaxID=3483 RepID=A0A803PQL8_CANSA
MDIEASFSMGSFEHGESSKVQGSPLPRSWGLESHSAKGEDGWSAFQANEGNMSRSLCGSRGIDLTTGGKLSVYLKATTTLVSSVLQSIPTYFMSTSLVPKSTCEELDKHVARFWWVGIHPDKDRFCALKSWGDLCQPKNCGGLGFRRFQDMNIALLSKLCWMVLQQKEKLWVNVLLGKYCSSVNAWVVEKKDQDSMIWKSIIQTRDVCLKGVVIANGDTHLWTTPGSREVYTRNQRRTIIEFMLLTRLRFLNIQDRTCVFCKEETEDLMHIITRCNITRGLWFQSRWGLLDRSMGRNTIFAFISRVGALIEDHELKVFTPRSGSPEQPKFSARYKRWRSLLPFLLHLPSHDRAGNIPAFQVDASELQ